MFWNMVGVFNTYQYALECEKHIKSMSDEDIRNLPSVPPEDAISVLLSGESVLRDIRPGVVVLCRGIWSTVLYVPADVEPLFSQWAAFSFSR